MVELVVPPTTSAARTILVSDHMRTGSVAYNRQPRKVLHIINHIAYTPFLTQTHAKMATIASGAADVAML